MSFEPGYEKARKENILGAEIRLAPKANDASRAHIKHYCMAH